MPLLPCCHEVSQQLDAQAFGRDNAFPSELPAQSLDQEGV